MYGLKELIKGKNKMSKELDITENLGLLVKNQENISKMESTIFQMEP